MVGILAAGLTQNLVEDSMYWCRVTLQTNTERGSVVRDVPFVYIDCIPRHTARVTSVSTPSSASVQEALKRMSFFERQRLHGEGGKGHDCRSRGTEASKEETDTTNDDRVQGSLLSHCCALVMSETTTHSHVRIFLAGLPRNDLRRLGYHLRS